MAWFSVDLEEAKENESSFMNWRQKLSQVEAIMGIMHGSRALSGPFQANISLGIQKGQRYLITRG